MDRNLAAITIFTLLFAVSTARISLDHPTPTNLHVPHSSFHRQPDCALQDSNLRFVPKGTNKPGSDGTLKSDKDCGVKVDLMPRSDFARFHAINRHFFDEPRVPVWSTRNRPQRDFQNAFVKPRSSKISHGNEVTIKETAQRQASSKWLKFKHDYQHERYQHQHHQHQHHQHQHQHYHDKESNNVSLRRHKFVGEKMNGLVHQHKAKTSAPEAGFLTSIRKFMKHSFD